MMRLTVVSVVMLAGLDRAQIPAGQILDTSCLLIPCSLVQLSWVFDGGPIGSECGVWVPRIRFFGMSGCGVLRNSIVVIRGVAWY